MKKTIFLAVIILSIWSCSSNKDADDEKQELVSGKTDTEFKEELEKKSQIPDTILVESENNKEEFKHNFTEKISAVKEIEVPFDNSKGDNNVAKVQISQSDWQNLSFNKLEKYESTFNYSIYGQVTLEKSKLLIIERDYTYETVEWIVLVDENLNLLDYLNIGYENEEGSTVTHSLIDKESIKVSTWSTLSDPDTIEEVYKIQSDGFKLE